MTCIIGYIDVKNNCVWIGCDSLGSNGHTKAVESQPKIFRNDIFENVVMGSTSSFRHIDLQIKKIQQNRIQKCERFKRQSVYYYK